jgi:hypothetical protein
MADPHRRRVKPNPRRRHATPRPPTRSRHTAPKAEPRTTRRCGKRARTLARDRKLAACDPAARYEPDYFDGVRDGVEIDDDGDVFFRGWEGGPWWRMKRRWERLLSRLRGPTPRPVLPTRWYVKGIVHEYDEARGEWTWLSHNTSTRVHSLVNYIYDLSYVRTNRVECFRRMARKLRPDVPGNVSCRHMHDLVIGARYTERRNYVDPLRPSTANELAVLLELVEEQSSDASDYKETGDLSAVSRRVWSAILHEWTLDFREPYLNSPYGPCLRRVSHALWLRGDDGKRTHSRWAHVLATYYRHACEDDAAWLRGWWVEWSRERRNEHLVWLAGHVLADGGVVEIGWSES